MDFKFNGVCSLEDFNFLSQQGVEYISFDFRTLSPTFIQLYKACEIITQKNLYKSYIILIFDNDKEFVINEVYKQICNVYDSSKVIIEFAGLENYEILRRVDVKFMLNFHNALDPKSINQKNLFALKFTYSDITGIDGDELYMNALKKFPNTPICIDSDWDNDFTLSVFDYPQVKLLSFSLNSLTQKSFRVVDQEKIHAFLNYNNHIFNQDNR